MKRREFGNFNLAFLDLLTGALGAVIILFIATPKGENVQRNPQSEKVETPVGNKSNDKAELQFLKKEMKASLTKQKILSDQLVSSQEEVKKLKEELAAQIQKVQEKSDQQDKEGGIPADVGFKFKGKYIVFVIDVSGSMNYDDKIGQVKAGLKMLITSMGTDFYISVVQYPFRGKRDHHALWRHLKSMTPENKTAVYNYLHNLKAYGSTPTRSVMKWTLERYQYATDIVLLSDGAPTISGKAKLDQIDDVLDDISLHNTRKVQISTIGVGKDFLVDKTNPRFRFLKDLAEKNGGFFHGF